MSPNNVLNPQIIAQTAVRMLEDDLLEQFIAALRREPRASWVKAAMAVWFAKVDADLEHRARQIAEGL